MNKSLSALAIALASVAFGASAQGMVSYAYQKDGELVLLESRNNSIFLPKVAAVLEKAGYARLPTSTLPPGTKTDTWCKVDVYMERQILGECYTPQMGHGISVRSHLAWTREEFKGDYSGVPTMVAQLREEHRRASTFIGIK